MDPQPHKFDPEKDRLVKWKKDEEVVDCEVVDAVLTEVAKARKDSKDDTGALYTIALKLVLTKDALLREGFYRTKDKQSVPRKRPEEGSL